MPADYGLTIDKLIDHNKLQNKMIASQIDELTIIRSKLATVEHDAKITRYMFYFVCWFVYGFFSVRRINGLTKFKNLGGC